MHKHIDGCCGTAASHALSGLRGPLGRRRFLTLAAMGGGVALLSATPLRHAAAAGNVEALLLSCMDYRLIDDTARYMDQRGMTNNYDHVILAGASLGALTEKSSTPVMQVGGGTAQEDSLASSWQQTFWEHVDVAKTLHHIRKVIIIDHRDCGAYRVFLGQDLKDDPVKEKQVHTDHLLRLAAAVKRKHSELEVETLLMSLDGSVEVCA